MLSIHNLTIPTSWSDVSVEKFIELKQVESSDFESILSYRMDRLFVLTETSIESEIWAEINTDQLAEISSILSWLNKQPTLEFKKEIKGFVFKELDTLTLGEFIDLEHVFSSNYIEKLPNICAILYRQIKTDDFGNKQIEGREYNEAERANLFFDLTIPEVFGVLQTYLSFKKKFTETFEELFLEPDFEPIEAEEKTKDDITKEKLLVKWSWERTIYMLANEDVLRFNEIVKLPLVFVFNMLSMKKDLKI